MTDQTNDVLNRLRAMAATGGWNANIIRGAIIEIERLRAAWAEVVSKPIEPPQPERWEVSTKHIATQDWQSVGGEPFAVSDTGRVWFRRREP